MIQVVRTEEQKERKMIRERACSRCGIKGRIEGHHNDYSKSLEVVWLCQKCHKEAHRLKLKQDSPALYYCKNCNQMTNHKVWKNHKVCQKCKSKPTTIKEEGLIEE